MLASVLSALLLQDFHMRPITNDELLYLVMQCELSDDDARDALLTDMLVRPYPTTATQDN
jgi:hypothetical protein